MSGITAGYNLRFFHMATGLYLYHRQYPGVFEVDFSNTLPLDRLVMNREGI